MTDKNDGGAKTEKYQDNIVCSYGYKLICVNEQYSRPQKTYFREDAISKVINDITNESRY